MSTSMLEDAPRANSPQSQWAVETHGLTKRFGGNIAVNNVELLVPRGSAFGYLGPNGAGKTTLIRTLLGLTHPDAGTMSLLGYPVPRLWDMYSSADKRKARSPAASKGKAPAAPKASPAKAKAAAKASSAEAPPDPAP